MIECIKKSFAAITGLQNEIDIGEYSDAYGIQIMSKTGYIPCAYFCVEKKKTEKGQLTELKKRWQICSKNLLDRIKDYEEQFCIYSSD